SISLRPLPHEHPHHHAHCGERPERSQREPQHPVALLFRRLVGCAPNLLPAGVIAPSPAFFRVPTRLELFLALPRAERRSAHLAIEVPLLDVAHRARLDETVL